VDQRHQEPFSPVAFAAGLVPFILQGQDLFVQVVVDLLPESSEVMSRAAKAGKELIFRTPAKLYSCETILEWLAQDLKDMAAKLGPCIQEEHAMVGPRHVARHRPVAPADQPRIRNGVVGRATRTRRDQRRWTGFRKRPWRCGRRCGRRRGGYAWSQSPRRGSSPAGWWSAAVPASTVPPQGGRAGAHYGQSACMTFSFTRTSRGADGHRR
jgi:hypothetical protein